MAHKIQLRGDTLANWTNENPVLWVNEPAIETNDGKFKMKVGDGVKEYLDLPYLAGEGGLSGTNYVFVQGNGTPSENAAELQAAYDLAKTMLPSSGNIVTVVVAPGIYTFGATKFPVNTPYINIVSLTGNDDVLLDGINVTANNVYLKGLNCGVNSFTVATNLNGLICENCIGGDESFVGGGIASGTFINCEGGIYSFGGDYSGTASGTFTNCTGGFGSFGSGTASGTFNNCTGGQDSFGGNGGTASGTFKNCTGGYGSFGSGTASGAFTNCTGGEYAFGGGGTASGTFINCTGEYGSFGGYFGTALGTFTDCIGGSYSFGGNIGTASGTFTNCTGGDGSFGGGGGTVSSAARLYYCTGGDGSFGGDRGTISSTARLYYCRLTSGTFETPQAGGKLVLCIDGTDAIITTT